MKVTFAITWILDVHKATHVKNVAFPLLDRRHQSMQILEMQLNIEIRNGTNHFLQLKLSILKLDIILYHKNSFYYFSKI